MKRECQVPNYREKDFIACLRKKYVKDSPELVKTFGEDCAVIKLTQNESFIISCDDFIEGTHFMQDYMTLPEAGRKALLTNISDIISMGQAPSYYLVSISLPKSFRKEKALELYAGMNSAARQYHIALIGGNTEAYNGPLALRITIIGKTRNNYLFFRSNAQAGDLIFISNRIGLSALGLTLLQRGWRKKTHTIMDNLGQPEKRNFLKRAIKEYIAPSIPFHECMKLSKHHIPHAAIDISDGLIQDLQEICKESHTGAIIHENKLPVSAPLLKYCSSAKIHFNELMLGGGEDYQLLFTVPEKNCAKLSKIFSPRKLYCIGKIIKDDLCRVRLYLHGKEKSLPHRIGYDHFQIGSNL